ncbi:hypothetical protein F4778DRAFT_289982 [Xylariomycetidae sp. FL2044]|nr:hypothetical protein F4778DRAFT_289982 [Xylariomycetidae sp. FL2044]
MQLNTFVLLASAAAGLAATVTTVIVTATATQVVYYPPQSAPVSTVYTASWNVWDDDSVAACSRTGVCYGINTYCDNTLTFVESCDIQCAFQTSTPTAWECPTVVKVMAVPTPTD